METAARIFRGGSLLPQQYSNLSPRASKFCVPSTTGDEMLTSTIDTVPGIYTSGTSQVENIENRQWLQHRAHQAARAAGVGDRGCVRTATW